METRPGRIDVGELFKKTLGVGLELLKQSVIQQASKTKAVQQEVEKQKTVAGKNLLWKYFPFFIIGTVGIILLAKVR